MTYIKTVLNFAKTTFISAGLLDYNEIKILFTFMKKQNLIFKTFFTSLRF
jgi:hypothetical protein